MVSEIPGFYHQPITIIRTSVTIIITCREAGAIIFLKQVFQMLCNMRIDSSGTLFSACILKKDLQIYFVPDANNTMLGSRHDEVVFSFFLMIIVMVSGS
jgi:hypothetical protein